MKTKTKEWLWNLTILVALIGFIISFSIGWSSNNASAIKVMLYILSSILLVIGSCKRLFMMENGK